MLGKATMFNRDSGQKTLQEQTERLIFVYKLNIEWLLGSVYYMSSIYFPFLFVYLRWLNVLDAKWKGECSLFLLLMYFLCRVYILRIKIDIMILIICLYSSVAYWSIIHSKNLAVCTFSGHLAINKGFYTVYTHTHTHIHSYINIYIYIFPLSLCTELKNSHFMCVKCVQELYSIVYTVEPSCV